MGVIRIHITLLTITLHAFTTLMVLRPPIPPLPLRIDGANMSQIATTIPITLAIGERE